MRRLIVAAADSRTAGSMPERERQMILLLPRISASRRFSDISSSHITIGEYTAAIRDDFESTSTAVYDFFSRFRMATPGRHFPPIYRFSNAR